MKSEVITGFLVAINVYAVWKLCALVKVNIRNSNSKCKNMKKVASVPNIPLAYLTRPYKRYSYDGGSVKRSHRFYRDDLVFINKTAESRNAYSSDVINGMINYFVENPELINVIMGDFQADKPRPDEKPLPDHLNN